MIEVNKMVINYSQMISGEREPQWRSFGNDVGLQGKGTG